jgi:hypothetical protein
MGMVVAIVLFWSNKPNPAIKKQKPFGRAIASKSGPIDCPSSLLYKHNIGAALRKAPVMCDDTALCIYIYKTRP